MASALDKLTAAKNSLAGDQVNLTVCKATNHDVLSPKRKHVDVLLTWSNNPNLSIPDLADRLFARVADTNWVVVFKAMIVSHEIMAKGGERFIQNLASRSSNFNVTQFLDKGNILGYDMSPFIRRYGNYLNEKAMAYRQMGYDFCRLKKTESGTELRNSDTAKLMKTIPVLQKLLDSLVDFQVHQGELGNAVIASAFLLLFRDLVKLFACYNDGIINLLEKFFDMKKPQAKECLDIYKKFLVRMDTVSEFLKVAESLGVHKDELPDLSKAPSSLLTALENHVQTVDKKPANASPLSAAISGPSNVKVGSLVLPASTAAALGMSIEQPAAKASPSLPPPSANPQAVADKKKQLEAEKARLLALKQHGGAGVSPSTSGTQAAVSADPLADLSGLSFGGAAAAVVAAQPPMSRGIEDLYALPQKAQPVAMAPSNPFPGAASNNPFGGAGDDLFASPQAPPIAAVPSSQSAAPLGMGEILTPDVMGEFGTKEAPKQKGLGTDLDSSLNIAAEGLSLNGQMPRNWENPQLTAAMKQQQFQPQTTSARTGGANWAPIQQSSTVSPQPTPMPMGGGASWGGQPMGQPMGMGMAQPTAQFGVAPVQAMGMQPGMGAMGGGMGVGMMQQRPMGGMGMMGQPQMGAVGMMGQPQQFGGVTNQDPFGPVPGAQSHF